MIGRRIVLAGTAGYGHSYLTRIADLEASGAVRLVGLCDVKPALSPEAAALFGDRPFDSDLERLLARTRPDIGIVATPIHTHLALSGKVLDAKAHLVLEKPPAPTADDWRELRDHAKRSGVACQIGFQSLGSRALYRLARLIRNGELGTVKGIGVYGAWSRDAAYYERAAWAGRRRLDGVPVVDGALTNPFAHAIATALALDASTGWDDIADIELELLRVRDIEADDTSCLRLRTVRGTVITVAVTLAAQDVIDPVVVVHGSERQVRLRYTEDILEFDDRTERYRRVSPLENLLAHLEDPVSVPLQSGIDECGGFMRVLEEVRTAPEPRLIDPAWLTTDQERPGDTGSAGRVYLAGITQAVRASAERLATFAELGVPWA